MEDNNNSGRKKEAFSDADKLVKFLTDTDNSELSVAVISLMKLGAQVFVSQRKEADPYCKELTIPSSSPLRFYNISMSQIGIIMPSSDSTGGNLYRFTLDELRLVTEKGKQEGCTVNVNNAIFFETDYKYFEPLSLLFEKYDKYEPLKTGLNEESWLKKLQEEMKTNGGSDLVEQWQELRARKEIAVKAQKYDEAGKIREEERALLTNLQEMLDKHFEVAVS